MKPKSTNYFHNSLWHVSAHPRRGSSLKYTDNQMKRQHRYVLIRIQRVCYLYVGTHYILKVSPAYLEMQVPKYFKVTNDRWHHHYPSIMMIKPIHTLV